MALFKNDAFAPDDWRFLPQGEDLPLEGKVILTSPQWEASREALQSANVPIGLLLEAGASVQSIEQDLPRFALVAIDFPKFSDGRGFSMARQLRRTGKFTGELRAVGDILFDQLQHLSRCGFDSYEIKDQATIRLLEVGRRPGLNIFYQPALGLEAQEPSRPWARRATI